MLGPPVFCGKLILSSISSTQMALATKTKILASEFLAWAEAAENDQRFELQAGQPVAMSPERNRHNLVKTACWQAINNSVLSAKLDCTVLGDGASVVISDEDVYEPDVTVQCGDPIDLDVTTVTSPCIVVEVLSPSTKGIDSGGKLYGYFQVPSINHYLMIDPVKRVVIHHYRSGSVVHTALINEGVVKLDPQGIEFSLADCFRSLG